MKYVLRLYITGRTGSSRQAIDSLERICLEEFPGAFQVEVVDVLEHPQLAEDEKILATPTLVKRLPPPLRKIVGDLSDRERVLLGLDLVTRAERLEVPRRTDEPRSAPTPGSEPNE